MNMAVFQAYVRDTEVLFHFIRKTLFVGNLF